MVKDKHNRNLYHVVRQNEEERKTGDSCFGCYFNHNGCDLPFNCQAHSKTIYKKVSDTRRTELKEIFNGDL